MSNFFLYASHLLREDLGPTPAPVCSDSDRVVVCQLSRWRQWRQLEVEGKPTYRVSEYEPSIRGLMDGATKGDLGPEFRLCFPRIDTCEHKSCARRRAFSIQLRIWLNSGSRVQLCHTDNACQRPVRCDGELQRCVAHASRWVYLELGMDGNVWNMKIQKKKRVVGLLFLARQVIMSADASELSLSFKVVTLLPSSCPCQ